MSSDGFVVSADIRANENNVCEFSLGLGQWEHGEVYDSPLVKWAYTGVLNRVVGARFSDEDADHRIREVIASIKSRGARHVQWIVGPSDRPTDLPSRLERYGFIRHEWTPMCAITSDIPAPPGLPASLEAIRVDASQMHPWSSVVCGGFGFPERLRSEFCEIFADLARQDPARYVHYLGLMDGSPATACTIFNGSDALGIYMVATLPEARRQGLATALLLHAMSESRSLGHKLVVLQATPAGKGVYERIGFREQCSMGVYVTQVEPQR